jgi:two-component system, sporulation sensor kinase B
MLIIFLTLWTLAVFFVLKDFKNEFMRWAAASAFVGGCGAFGRALIETFVPYLLEHSLIEPGSIIAFDYIYVFCTLSNIILLPFFFLMVCITYAKKNIKGKIKLFLLFFPVATLLYTIINKPVLPKPEYNYLILYIWTFPYIIYGFYLLLNQYIKENNPIIKQNHSLTILVCSPVLFQLFSVYTLRLFGFQESFRYNAVFFALYLPFIVYFLINYNVFGIRLRLEKNPLNQSIRAISSGTAILNHALKNQMLIVLACATIVKNDFIASDRNVPEELSIIDNSCTHMLEMVKKIQDQVQEIIIIYTLCNVKKMIENVLLTLNDLIVKNAIDVIVNCSDEVKINCDSTHVHEVLYNVLKNSIEAIENKGIIQIIVSENKKFFTISIIDNGNGISKSDLDKIFEPFYSTKKLKMNFGLGLTYCHQVMQKHKGSIYIKSVLNSGTTTFLNFPLGNRKLD